MRLSLASVDAGERDGYVVFSVDRGRKRIDPAEWAAPIRRVLRGRPTLLSPSVAETHCAIAHQSKQASRAFFPPRGRDATLRFSEPVRFGLALDVACLTPEIQQSNLGKSVPDSPSPI